MSDLRPNERAEITKRFGKQNQSQAAKVAHVNSLLIKHLRLKLVELQMSTKTITPIPLQGDKIINA